MSYFNPLILRLILDLANNHQGDVAHAKKITDALASGLADWPGTVALKLQLRDLPAFIHEDYRQSTHNKHIPRFLSTALSKAQICQVVSHARDRQLEVYATPFDEASVDFAVTLGVDVLKIASCSAQDWPLLEAVAEAGKPILFSTGGLSWSKIDDLVSFFEHRGSDFAMHHCVSIYPCPYANMSLYTIQAMQKRYPGVTLGWSTHEKRGETLPAAMAYAMGARLFEKHVGLEDDRKGYKLNGYSDTPNGVVSWAKAILAARQIAGLAEPTLPKPVERAERDALKSLMRGVYAKGALETGDRLTRENVYFAMPLAAPDQVTSSEFREGTTVLTRIEANGPVIDSLTLAPAQDRFQPIKQLIHQIKAQLHIAGIVLPPDFDVEYSHHYGIPQFYRTGATLITVFNRYYAKKLIILTPGQHHPSHYHKLKEESFHVLWGSLRLKIADKTVTLAAGEIITIPPGTWHEFDSWNGCIFEEVSTTAIEGDSVYADKRILPSAERKTKTHGWGRHQLIEHEDSGK